jgi:tRNA modification GTPase
VINNVIFLKFADSALSSNSKTIPLTHAYTFTRSRRAYANFLSVVRSCQPQITKIHMLKHGTRTIYALSTAATTRTPSALAVIRISGDNANHVLSHMIKTPNKITPRRATLCDLIDPTTKTHLDKSLLLHFPGPKSFTGEDMIELHVHGGTSVIQSIMQSLSKAPLSFEQALPGEFTRRAVSNGKMDLTEAEGLYDLLHAQTEQQRIIALKQMNGALGNLVKQLQSELDACLSYLVAYVDFGDDNEDISRDHAYDRGVVQGADRVLQLIDKHLSKKKSSGEMMRSGIQISLVGAPNAGKSSLLNALAKRDAAIVSHTAGTTRDIIDVHLDVGGYPVILSDTAGIRHVDETHDIELQGIKRALDRASESDLIIYLVDKTQNQAHEYCWNKLKEQLNSQLDRVIIVNNKSDIVSDTNEHVSISCKTGHNLDELIVQLTDRIKSVLVGTETDDKNVSALITRERHRAAFVKCRDDLEQFILHKESVDIASEYLRRAIDHLSSITGVHADIEQVLGRVFAEFCVGK